MSLSEERASIADASWQVEAPEQPCQPRRLQWVMLMNPSFSNAPISNLLEATRSRELRLARNHAVLSFCVGAPPMASLKTLSVMRHRHLCPCLSTMPKAIPSNSTSNPSFKRDKGISCSSGSSVHYNHSRHHDLRRDMFLRVVLAEGQDVPPEGLSAAGEGAFSRKNCLADCRVDWRETTSAFCAADRENQNRRCVLHRLLKRASAAFAARQGFRNASRSSPATLAQHAKALRHELAVENGQRVWRDRSTSLAADNFRQASSAKWCPSVPQLIKESTELKSAPAKWKPNCRTNQP